MSKTFLEGIKTPFAGLVKDYEVKNKDGTKSTLSYLPWSRALALANRPRQEIAYWHDAPYFELFGGAVVAISQTVREAEGKVKKQLTFLPILNGANQPIPMARVDARQISDTLNRCRAKSAAMVSGVGLSLYSGANADTLKFLRALKVTPTSDLSTVDPLTIKKTGKGAYIDWPSALAAARICDENFQWEVEWHNVVDRSTGEITQLPVLQAGTGWAVTVKLSFMGESHTEMLPIMGQVMVQTRNGDKLMDHQPLLNPTAHDWNRAVMRCLVKGIAMLTGYGLSVYANEEIDSLHVEPLQKGPETPTTEIAAAPEQPIVTDDPKEREALVADVLAVLADKKRDAQSLLTWLGRDKETQIAELSVADLKRSLSALNSSASRGRTNATTH